MKTKLTILLALIVTVSMAQTKSGFHIIATQSIIDFTTPNFPSTDIYLGENMKQNMNWGLEAGYYTGKFGLFATAQTDFDFDSEVLLGLKGSVYLFKLANINFLGSIASRAFIRPIDGSQWQHSIEGSANINLYQGMYCRLATTATINGNESRIYPGVSIGFGVSL